MEVSTESISRDYPEYAEPICIQDPGLEEAEGGLSRPCWGCGLSVTPMGKINQL